MKFDIVVGNPPYNRDIYLDFVVAGHEISNKCLSMITPNKWANKLDDANIRFKNKMAKHINKYVFYPDCLDVFAIGENDGVGYYLIDHDEHDKQCIVNKSARKPEINSIEYRSINNGETLWNVGNHLIEKLKHFDKYEYNEVVYTKKYVVNITNKFGHSRLTSGVYDIDNGCTSSKYIGLGGHLFSDKGCRVIMRCKIMRPEDEVAKVSTNIYTSDNIEECRSFASWLQCKLTRFMILIRCNWQSVINKGTFVNVLDPGPFDHIFTDEELYKKYGLSDAEIALVDSLVMTGLKNKEVIE